MFDLSLRIGAPNTHKKIYPNSVQFCAVVFQTLKFRISSERKFCNLSYRLDFDLGNKQFSNHLAFLHSKSSDLYSN